MPEFIKVIGRMAGVDYGTKRIGISTTDVEQRIAVPATTLDGTGDVRADAARVSRWFGENEIRGAVVGMPFNMDGTTGPQAALTGRFVAQLRELLPAMPVQTWDERLSSYQADEWLEHAGQKGKSKKRNPLRDALAATAILRSYLVAIQESARIENGGTSDSP